MRLAVLVMLGVAVASPAFAQGSTLDCATFATRTRAAAVQAREFLATIRGVLPPDLEKSAEEGGVDAEGIRQFGATMPKEYGTEFAEAMVGASYLLQPLEASTQRLEVAASAFEACAAKAP